MNMTDPNDPSNAPATTSYVPEQIRSNDDVNIPDVMSLGDIMSVAKDLTLRARNAYLRGDNTTAQHLLRKHQDLRTNFSHAFDEIESTYTLAGLYSQLGDYDPMIPPGHQRYAVRSGPTDRFIDIQNKNAVKMLGNVVGAAGSDTDSLWGAVQQQGMQQMAMRADGVNVDFYNKVLAGEAEQPRRLDTTEDFQKHVDFYGRQGLGKAWINGVRKQYDLEMIRGVRDLGDSPLANLVNELSAHQKLTTPEMKSKMNWIRGTALQLGMEGLPIEMDRFDLDKAKSGIVVQRNDLFSGGQSPHELTLQEVKNLLATPGSNPEESRQVRDWIRTQMSSVPDGSRADLQAKLIRELGYRSDESSVVASPILSGETIEAKKSASANAPALKFTDMFQPNSVIAPDVPVREDLFEKDPYTDAGLFGREQAAKASVGYWKGILQGAKSRYLSASAANDTRKGHAASHEAVKTDAEATMKVARKMLEDRASAAGMSEYPDIRNLLAGVNADSGALLATASTVTPGMPTGSGIPAGATKVVEPPDGAKVVGKDPKDGRIFLKLKDGTDAKMDPSTGEVRVTKKSPEK